MEEGVPGVMGRLDQQIGGDVPAEQAVPHRTPVSVARGVLKTMRPRQWVKNVLVLAAPMAAGSVTDLDVLGSVAIAFVAFCMAASGIYLVNDAMDVHGGRGVMMGPTNYLARSYQSIPIAITRRMVQRRGPVPSGPDPTIPCEPIDIVRF
jgi:hypothetical protein